MENTTSINSLPPPDANLPYNFDLPEQQVRHSSREIDTEIPLQMPPEQLEKPTQDIPKPKKIKGETLKDIHKVIILSTIYFMLFTDIKVRSYIINILVVIFGKFLRNAGGGTSKIGWIFYSIIYGLVLLATVSIINVSSYSLPF
jgi:hypothetical protein